jgi:kynurenine formamidase
MRFRTLAIGYVLVLAVYLFAKSHVNSPQPANHFSRVVDLTRPQLKPHDAEATVVEGPPGAAPSRWTAPLVVLDVQSEIKSDPRHQISVEDIADWELAHGEIPADAVVIARTRLDANATTSFAGYSMDAVQFLVEGREVLAIGSDTTMGNDDFSRFAYARTIYRLKNVANLERVPMSGSAMMATLQPVRGRAKTIPVQLLAMVR